MFFLLFSLRTQRTTYPYTRTPRSSQCPSSISSISLSPLNARQNYSTSCLGTMQSLSLQISSTETVFGILRKWARQSSLKSGRARRCSISRLRKQSTREISGCGRLVYLATTRLTTSYSERKGLSSTNLSTILWFLAANMTAVTAPMLLPQTVSRSISWCLQASRSTVSASADSFSPQVRYPSSLLPHPTKSKEMTASECSAISGITPIISILLPPLP